MIRAFILLLTLLIVPPVHAQLRIAVYFPPDGGATAALVKALDAAHKEVLIQAYSFTSAPIAKALTDAHKRSVSIKVVLDKSNETAQYSSAICLANAGIQASSTAERRRRRRSGATRTARPPNYRVALATTSPSRRTS